VANACLNHFSTHSTAVRLLKKKKKERRRGEGKKTRYTKDLPLPSGLNQGGKKRKGEDEGKR